MKYVLHYPLQEEIKKITKQKLEEAGLENAHLGHSRVTSYEVGVAQVTIGCIVSSGSLPHPHKRLMDKGKILSVVQSLDFSFFKTPPEWYTINERGSRARGRIFLTIEGLKVVPKSIIRKLENSLSALQTLDVVGRVENEDLRFFRYGQDTEVLFIDEKVDQLEGGGGNETA